MQRYFAFLRAINVGGRTVAMEKLRAQFQALGLAKVETFIASGNVIFEAKPRDPKVMQRKIEKHLTRWTGYEVAAFVRTEAEVAAIALHDAFNQEELESAHALNVAFFAEPLGADSATTVMTFKTGIDDFRVHGREVYWLCRRMQSESTFSNRGARKSAQAADNVSRHEYDEKARSEVSGGTQLTLRCTNPFSHRENEHYCHELR